MAVPSFLMTLMPAQLVMFTGIGAMKSFTADVNESEERLFRYALPNVVQLPVGRIPPLT